MSEWSIIVAINSERLLSLSLLELSERPADFVWLNEPEDVATWLEQHQALPTRPIGPQSWIERDRSQGQLLQALNQGRYSTGTGPALRIIETASLLNVHLHGLESATATLHSDGQVFVLPAAREWDLELGTEGWLWARADNEWALVWIGDSAQRG